MQPSSFFIEILTLVCAHSGVRHVIKLIERNSLKLTNEKLAFNKSFNGTDIKEGENYYQLALHRKDVIIHEQISIS
jgi:hypothetical protein